jgi:dTDP-4-amino-4,6-dideoxygalactose transaminase
VNVRQERLDRQLRALAEARTGRPCLTLPSGRLALYLALRHWFRPRDRVLMSPVTDDVVLFVVLAAGLWPVAAPVSPWTGNIDPSAVPEHTWKTIAGVLTANLYGLPDPVIELRERCDEHGLTLIEDACHAIGMAVDGRPIGTFGSAGAYSLSKHAGAAAGGFLAVAEARDVAPLERLRDRLTTEAVPSRDIPAVAQSAARPWVKRSPIGGPLWMTMQWLHLLGRTGGYRMPLRPRDLEEALALAPDLDAFDSWIRVDLPSYRRRPSSLLAWWLRRRLRAIDTQRSARLAGVGQLMSLPCATPALRDDGRPGERSWPVFRVPLFVRDRDDVVAALRRCGVVSGYIYDPPLDDYAGPGFMDLSPSPEPARWFARHALPADPLDAERLARLLDQIGAEPACWTGSETLGTR